MATIDPTRHGVIQASAGTGKTYTLTELAVRLLTEEKAKLDQILLVTYTEKAAGELRDRLRGTLERVLRDCPEQRHVAQQALDGFDQAPVYTIHGFCQRVLQDYPFENRHAFQSELVYDNTLFEPALRELQRRDWPARYEDGLAGVLELSQYDGEKWENEVLRLAQAFRPACGHRLLPDVSAGFAEGFQQIEQELSAEWAALRTMAGITGPGTVAVHPWWAGFDQLGESPKRAGPRRDKVLMPLLSWLTDPQMGDRCAAGFLTMLNACGKLASFADHGFLILTEKLNQQARGRLDAVCPGLREVAATLEERRQKTDLSALRWQLAVQTIHQLHEHLETHKRERGLQSFEDMLGRVDEALDPARNRLASALLAALRQRFLFAVVDEFQDTDPLQWRIFQRIFVAGAEKQRLYVVGDPKQAIYSFRGADLHAYRNACTDLVDNHAGVNHSLDTNWRSCPELLKGLNRLFDAGGWFDNADIRYTQVQPADESLRPLRVVDDQTDRAALSLVRLADLDTLTAARRVMGKFIAAEVQRLLRPGGGLQFARKGEPARPLHAGDICILVRTRMEARPTVEALAQAGIPYTFYKQPGLWQSPQAVHLGYVLRALAAPDDPAAFKKALLTRFFRVPPAALSQCDEIPPGTSARDLFLHWRSLAEGRRWAALFQSLLEDSGILFALDQQEEAERQQANYRHICQALAQIAYQRDLDLLDVIETLDRKRRGADEGEDGMQPIETDADKVKVMTIHAAKGLEFPVVFLAGGFTSRASFGYQTYHDDEGRLVFDLSPDDAAKSRAEAERAAEDRRLYYVALTRAAFKLYLPHVIRGTIRRLSFQGPLVKIVAPAVEQANLLDLDEGCVREVEPDKASASRPTSSTGQPAAPPLVLPGELFPFVDSRLADRRIFTSSFTSLHRAAQQVEESRYVERLPRHDDDATDALEDAPALRGPVFGEMLHEIMEVVDFELVGRAAEARVLPADVVALIHDITRRHWPRVPEYLAGDDRLAACREELSQLVWAALHTPLAGIGGPLWKIPKGDRLHELEFHFPAKDVAPPPETRQGELFLTGSIDLVFRLEKRLYLLDWKSNWLPAGYGAAAVAECMRDSDYHRQYRLYLQALRRWHGPKAEFGGVYYLFVRGMNGVNEDAGVFFHRPKADDFDLQRVLRGGGDA